MQQNAPLQRENASEGKAKAKAKAKDCERHGGAEALMKDTTRRRHLDKFVFCASFFPDQTLERCARRSICKARVWGPRGFGGLGRGGLSGARFTPTRVNTGKEINSTGAGKKKANVKTHRYPCERRYLPLAAASEVPPPYHHPPPQSHRDVQLADHSEVGPSASSMWPKFAFKNGEKHQPPPPHTPPAARTPEVAPLSSPTLAHLASHEI